MTDIATDTIAGQVIGADFSRGDCTILHVAVPTDTLVSKRNVTLTPTSAGAERPGNGFAVAPNAAELAAAVDLDDCWGESPGNTIEAIVYALRAAITGPDGYEIIVDALKFDSDADMVLVRVGQPDGKCASTYAVDWDDIAPRSMWDAPYEVTVDEALQVLAGVVAEANRAIS